MAGGSAGRRNERSDGAADSLPIKPFGNGRDGGAGIGRMPFFFPTCQTIEPPERNAAQCACGTVENGPSSRKDATGANGIEKERRAGSIPLSFRWKIFFLQPPDQNTRRPKTKFSLK